MQKGLLFCSVVSMVSTSFFSLCLPAWGGNIPDEDGYELWLRYRPIADDSLRNTYRQHAAEVVVQGNTPISGSVRDELQQGLSGLLDKDIPVSEEVTQTGAVVAGCPATSPLIAGLGWDAELATLGEEGFIIRSVNLADKPVTVIAGGSDRGVLYGAFRYLSQLQQYKPIDNLNLSDRPVNARRLLNHWDNWRPTVHGTIERGYAGGTLWKWDELPETVDPRYRDYARANASIGINGSVINNVNAQIEFIQRDNLPKVAVLADIFRAYGITLYMSVRYDSPIAIGGLETADPLDPEVIQWWQDKVAAIYHYIPDFGGFLVKGDSEGQPGPLQYGRNHAVGSNMLADALRPHGGIVMWRTFVYVHGSSRLSSDRVKQAYQIFEPLDGQFADNVIIQAKDGPLDFQVREPVNPLFGQMPETNIAAELMITQEYTGTNVVLCWQVPKWKEIFDFDTQAKGPGSTVRKVLDGSLFDHDLSLVAGVANTGSDRNWTGHLLGQANWYGFGRLAWNPDLDEQVIAKEWTRMTFSNDQQVVSDITSLLMGSWETFERYTSPVGLGIMVERPIRRMMPTPAQRQNFHRATDAGVGYDRTRDGSGYVDQYHQPVADKFNSLETCPEELLLWFHHVPYTHQLKSGKSLIQTIYDAYYQGVREVEAMIEKWQGLEGQIDAQRYAHVLERLNTQLDWAVIWRDTCVEYFYQMSGIADESGRFGPISRTNVQAGQTAEFTVPLSDLSPDSVVWYKGDTPLTAGDNITIETTDSDSTLAVADVGMDDQGVYKCVITLADEELTLSFHLAVKRLLAHYEFEQNLYDSIGDNHGAAVPDMAYAEGIAGDYAADPDGTNYVLLPEGAYPKAGFANGLDEFTYSAWVKRGSLGGNRRIMGNFNEGSNTGIQFTVNTNGDVLFFLRSEGGFGLSIEVDGVTTADTWHHLAATFSNDGFLRLYVDGVEVGRTDNRFLSPDFAQWQQGTTLMARNVRGTVVDHFDGQLDDLKIFNYAKSAEDIALMVEMGSGSDHTRWAANWPHLDLSDPDADHQGDGYTNREERIWGLDPTDPSSKNPIVLPLVPDGTFHYSRRDPALTGKDFSVWVSTDLVNWSEDTGVTQQPASAAGRENVQIVEVTVSPAHLSEPRLFVRMRAE